MFLMEKDCILYRVNSDFQIDKLHSITQKELLTINMIFLT